MISGPTLSCSHWWEFVYTEYITSYVPEIPNVQRRNVIFILFQVGFHFILKSGRRWSKYFITARVRSTMEGNVLTRVCLSVHRGVPISHNALQHYPECHGAAEGVPCQVQLGGYPARGTLPGGVPCWGVPCLGGYLIMVPPQPGQDWGGTQLGQHREYLLHGGRYASCVHAGGLSCLKYSGIHVELVSQWVYWTFCEMRELSEMP